MPIKIDYSKCCWKDGKCASSGCGCGSGGCDDKSKKAVAATVCDGCVEACPVEALERKKKLVLDKEKCIECGACVAACKHDALALA